MDNFPDVVELNVGGQLTTTLLSTLTKDPDSMLAAMFSGRHVISKDKDGRFFIDCDGHVFTHILNYLRFGNLPPKESILEVHDIAVYFNIQALVDSLGKYHALQHRKRIAELKSQFDLQQYEKLKEQAIDQIYSCSASPHEDKTLHIVIDSNKCPHGRDKCFYNRENIAVHYRNNINIFLITSCNISKELRLCLAHDLSELGFGRYSYICDSAIPVMDMCFCNMECHHILLSYKTVSVH